MSSVQFDGISVSMLIGVFLVMAGFTCTIELQQFLTYIKKPKAVIIGLLCQFIILPLTALAICLIFKLTALESIGLILTASCPGGTLSNFWCWFYGADLALSIAMTTSSSLLSFIFLTINCLIYIPLISDTNTKIDYISLTISVFVLVLGVIFGLIIGYKKYDKCKRILHILGGVSVIVLILVGLYQNTLVSDKTIYESSLNIFLSAVILNLIAWFSSLILSFFMFRLSNNQSIAVCIECANQNVGLAISIVLLTFDNKDDANIAVGVPMLYGALNATFILFLGWIFRVFGFIKNENDGHYERAGYTKCVTLCRKKNCHLKDDDKTSLELENEISDRSMDDKESKMSPLNESNKLIEN